MATAVLFSTAKVWKQAKCSLIDKRIRRCSRYTMEDCVLSRSAAAAKSLQSCPTLCDPVDGSLLGSSVPGILQARILEWVVILFFGGSSQPWSPALQADSLPLSHESPFHCYQSIICLIDYFQIFSFLIFVPNIHI